MAKRRWLAKWNMGFVGTDSEEKVDLIDDYGFSKEDVAEMPDDEAEELVCDHALECAIQKINKWAEPLE